MKIKYFSQICFRLSFFTLPAVTIPRRKNIAPTPQKKCRIFDVLFFGYIIHHSITITSQKKVPKENYNYKGKGKNSNNDNSNHKGSHKDKDKHKGNYTYKDIYIYSYLHSIYTQCTLNLHSGTFWMVFLGFYIIFDSALD